MRTLGERTRPAPVFFSSMARSDAILQQLSSACKAAADLVTDAAAIAAAAQPTVALSDYESERLEAAVKGSVVKMRDGKWGIVKFTYATRRGHSGVSIAVDFDGGASVHLKPSEWSDHMEAIDSVRLLDDGRVCGRECGWARFEGFGHQLRVASEV